MPKSSKNLVALGIIIMCVAAFAGFKAIQAQLRPTRSETMVKQLPERSKGNPDAQIKIIEFIDFQCPACANGSKLLHEYMDKNPDTMFVELRYFPLKMHSHGLLSARWGECAVRQGKFWPFLDRLLEKQKEWSALIDPVPSFSAIAKSVQMDMGALNACLEDDGIDAKINADREEGTLREVSSTPTYFINHEMVVGTKSLQAKLDELLLKSNH